MNTRNLHSDELDAVNNILDGIRQRYAEWSDAHRWMWELIDFVLYEGIVDDAVATAAPLAIGEFLVEHHGCRWVMIRANDAWHYGITHPNLDQPVDLQSLEDGAWCDAADTGDEPPMPGETTIASVDCLVDALLGRSWDRPKGKRLP